MKKTLIILLTITVFATMGTAQDAQKSIRLSYGYVGGTMERGTEVNNRENYLAGGGESHLLLLDIDLWSLKNAAAFGFYAGFGKGCYLDYPDAIGVGLASVESTPGMHWGFSASLHLLPLAGCTSERWDVALSGRLGTYWQAHFTPQAEYGLGVAASFYPLPHWGISLENIWGRFLFTCSPLNMANLGNSLLKAGISYRF